MATGNAHERVRFAELAQGKMARARKNLSDAQDHFPPGRPMWRRLSTSANYFLTCAMG